MSVPPSILSMFARLLISLWAAAMFGASAQAGDTAPTVHEKPMPTGLSSSEIGSGLKQALSQGAGRAVDALGRQDGFLGNPEVSIPLPESLQKLEALMRKLGLGKQADELITSMNRAAELAVHEAKPLLQDAIRKMTLLDAMGILMGADDAATQYFRRTTSTALSEKLRPVVKTSIAKVKLAERYQQFAARAAKLGLLPEQDAELEHYVTQKALDGLFFMIAAEEKAIRNDPAGAAGKLAKKVFGALK